MNGIQVLSNRTAPTRSSLWKVWVQDQRITWFITVVFVLAPAILLGSPFLPMIVLVFGVFFRALIVGVFAAFNKKPVATKARSMFIFFLTSVGMTIYALEIDKLIPTNALPIVSTIEKFRVENGRYPESMDAVIPKYLSVIPTLRPTLSQPSISVELTEGKAVLRIESAAGDAFANYEYDFEAKAWEHHS